MIRQRAVRDGFHEWLKILNHDDRPVELTVRIEAGSDFADLFEVKDALEKKGRYSSRVEDGRLLLAYERQAYRRSTVISATAGARVDEEGLTFDVRLQPHGEWTTEIDVAATCLRVQQRGGRPPRQGNGGGRTWRSNLGRWIGDAPRLECDWEPLRVTYRRSLVDLAARRFSLPITPGKSLPAAGLPWFMTVFGRDSIFTSLQALPFNAELAATTLRVLRLWQGTRVDDFATRIRSHPARVALRGDDGVRGAPTRPTTAAPMPRPCSSCCSTSTSGGPAIGGSCTSSSRRPGALNWIDEFADLMGNGYVSYQRRNEKTGLENQCWKDSWDSISYRTAGCQASPERPVSCRATRTTPRSAAPGSHARSGGSGVRRSARAAGRRPEAPIQPRLLVESDQYFALALDADGNQVDALSSNNGHLLWSGIVETSKAKAVARHLMGPRLFTGWGIRTLAEGEGRFNPVGYHVGTIWPFDNSFIAWGLRRYGFKQEAAQIAAGILNAAAFFDGRLPRRSAATSGRRQPIRGVSNRVQPQAWSTGAPLLLLRTMLGLEPLGDHLIVDPALPSGIGVLALLEIPGRWGRVDAFARGDRPHKEVGSATAARAAQGGPARRR